jgi:hypothetical protein
LSLLHKQFDIKLSFHSRSSHPTNFEAVCPECKTSVSADLLGDHYPGKHI